MSIAHFIAQYGYWAVLMGAMIEGESVILTASALAGAGKMSIWSIALITFWGTLVADQGIFILGRHKGPRVLHSLQRRWPSLTPHVHKALAFLQRNQTLYILSFRFIYGVRILSPFVLGTQGIPFARFSVLNAASAFLWTSVSCAAGYGLGALASQYTKNLNWIIAGTVGLVMTSSLLIGHIKMRRAGKAKKFSVPSDAPQEAPPQPNPSHADPSQEGATSHRDPLQEAAHTRASSQNPLSNQEKIRPNLDQHSGQAGAPTDKEGQ